MEAFGGHDYMADGAETYYAQVYVNIDVAKDVIYTTTILIGDGFFVYRLFVVWNRSWRITVMPLLLLTGTMGESDMMGFSRHAVVNLTPCCSTVQ